MTTADYEAETKKLDELTRRIEKLEQHYGITPKTLRETFEERIEKFEKAEGPSQSSVK
jgi:hypothetical protein